MSHADNVELAMKDVAFADQQGVLWPPARVLRDEVLRLRAELETERMRLAGCGVAALGYFDGCHPDYESASLHDTVRLYAEKERLRLALEAKEGGAT